MPPTMETDPATTATYIRYLCSRRASFAAGAVADGLALRMSNPAVRQALVTTHFDHRYLLSHALPRHQMHSLRRTESLWTPPHPERESAQVAWFLLGVLGEKEPNGEALALLHNHMKQRFPDEEKESIFVVAAKSLMAMTPVLTSPTEGSLFETGMALAALEEVNRYLRAGAWNLPVSYGGEHGQHEIFAQHVGDARRELRSRLERGIEELSPERADSSLLTLLHLPELGLSSEQENRILESSYSLARERGFIRWGGDPLWRSGFTRGGGDKWNYGPPVPFFTPPEAQHTLPDAQIAFFLLKRGGDDPSSLEAAGRHLQRVLRTTTTEHTRYQWQTNGVEMIDVPEGVIPGSLFFSTRSNLWLPTPDAPGGMTGVVTFQALELLRATTKMNVNRPTSSDLQ